MLTCLSLVYTSRLKISKIYLVFLNQLVDRFSTGPDSLMFSSRFFWRIYLSQLLLIFLAVALFSVTILPGYRVVCERLLHSEMEILAEGLSQDAASFFSESVPQELQQELNQGLNEKRNEKLSALAAVGSCEIHLFEKRENWLPVLLNAQIKSVHLFVTVKP